MKTFRWGIFGTGAVSAKFVAGLASARNAKAEFVASRSLHRAQTFAKGTGISRAIEGYSEAAAAGGVDAIYIATPPSEHLSHALLCIEAGIPVLIEKPIAATGEDARLIADAAKKKSVFAMEGMWTRFLPAAQALRERVEAGAVGEARIATGNFGTSQVVEQANGMFNKSLGGGAVSHLGCYPLSLAQWLFGSPTFVKALGTIGTTGVDEDAAFQVKYSRGTIGSFFVSIRAWAPDDFQVLGTHGALAVVGSIVRPHGLRVSQEAPRGFQGPNFGWREGLRQNAFVHQIAQRANRSSRGGKRNTGHYYRGNGYHYEADEVRACLEKGMLESTTMPLCDSIEIAALCEKIRTAISDGLQ